MSSSANTRISRYALSYACCYPDSFERFLRSAAARGFRAVELIPDQAPNLYSEFPQRRINEIRNIAASEDLRILVHNVFYDINIVSLVPDVQEAALKITKQVLELSAKLGAQTVTVHPGYFFPGWRGEMQRTRFWESAKRGLSLLTELAQQFQVPVLLENGSYHVCTVRGSSPRPLHLGITPAELQRALQLGGESLGVCLDVAKAYSTGIDIADFLGALGRHVRQVQVPIQGRPHSEAWPHVRTYLSEHDFDGFLVLEAESDLEPLRLDNLLWPSP